MPRVFICVAIKHNAQCVVKVLTQPVSSLLHSRLLNTVNNHLEGFLMS